MEDYRITKLRNYLFDIIIYMFKKDFAYEALTQMIKKYNLAELKYVEGESKPCYVITEKEQILPLFNLHIVNKIKISR